MPDTDVIDTVLGIGPGHPLAPIRARRPEAKAQAETSYRALFAPATPGDVSLEERFALAVFVTGLHSPAAEIGKYYGARLASAPLRQAVGAAIAEATGQGPYGSYPAGPLSHEDKPGSVYRAGAATRGSLGARLAAAFEHVHMLVYHPRDAAPPALQALLDAGWSTTGIVTLSQLVAFLSFQIRVIAGLGTLSGHR